jgi:hypothetical protein
MNKSFGLINVLKCMIIEASGSVDGKTGFFSPEKTFIIGQ